MSEQCNTQEETRQSPVYNVLVKINENPILNAISIVSSVVSVAWSIIVFLYPDIFKNIGLSDLYTFADNFYVKILSLAIPLSLLCLIIWLQHYELKRKALIYARRDDFLSHELRQQVEKARGSIKILNTSFSWFEDQDGPRDLIEKKIEQQVTFEILLVCRKRKVTDKSHLDQREKDINVPAGNLVVRMNKTLFGLLNILVKIAYRNGNNNPNIINKLIIKEYNFMPTICMYCFDDFLVFGPYLAEECKYMPLIKIGNHSNKDTSSIAYSELMKHFETISTIGSKNSNRMRVIDSFTYYNGPTPRGNDDNRNIHKFILENQNYNKIYEILNKNENNPSVYNYNEYYAYLTDVKFCCGDKAYDDRCIGSGLNRAVIDELKNDPIIKAHGNDNLEVRFDAVMRHIYKMVNSPATSVPITPIAPAGGVQAPKIK